MDEMTCGQAARLWDISPRRVQMYCARGRINGARHVGRIWLLPCDTQKPGDPRTSRHPQKKQYWPRLLLLDGDVMRVQNEAQVLAQAKSSEARKQLAGQMAYMRGDYAEAAQCIQGVHEDDPSYLAAMTISTAARISMGDTRGFQDAWNRLSSLQAGLSDHPQARIMAELAQGTIAISAFAPQICAAWLTDGVFTCLPAPALPFALYLRCKALLALGQIERLQGMAQAALSLLPGGFGVEEAYLYIMIAHACLHQDKMDKAREALMRAIDICLPNGFISPFAENISSLLGLGEQCLQQACPDLLPKILTLHSTLSRSWLTVHNMLTHEHIATVLTRREYQVALSVASGLNNHDSAQQLGISMATLKGYLQNIYQKLGITNRKDLKEHIIVG